jgi:UDP-N-acetylmuramate--alanine ligase
MKIYFVGLGGIGISGLAQLCESQGHQVSGSNLGETEVFPILKGKKITVFSDHRAEYLDSDTDRLVYSEAVGDDNPERIRASELGILQQSYFEFLGEMARDFRLIAVAGTHGKTTTTGLIASGLLGCGFDFSCLVGSTLEVFGGSNFWSSSSDLEKEKKPPEDGRPWLLVEACEYRENFRFLDPEIVVLTNVEWDHADHFKTPEHYYQAFGELCHKARMVITHQDLEHSEKILGPTPVQFVPTNSHPRLNLSIPGAHNQKNAQLAQKLGNFLGLDPSAFVSGLESFSGAGRRQEFLGAISLPDFIFLPATKTPLSSYSTKNLNQRLLVFDDYGHHPTEIRVTIEAFLEKFPDKKIGLIFEPHQYSRTRQFFDAFVESLSLAHKVGIFPIYAARDTAEDRASVSTQDLVAAGSGFVLIESEADVLSFLSGLDPGDILLFMGAGKISSFARDFLKSFQSRI